jgi:hypothetical protein
LNFNKRKRTKQKMNFNKNNADLFQVNYATTQQPQKIDDIIDIEEMAQKYKPEGVGLIELARYDTLTVEKIPNLTEGILVFLICLM